MNQREFRDAATRLRAAGVSLRDWLRGDDGLIARWESGAARVPGVRARQMLWLLRTDENRRARELDLMGPDTFWINDTAEVNPGCHYRWTIRATGPQTSVAEPTSGRILTSLDLAAPPVDTMYVWDGETIQPLFGSPQFHSGEVRQSGSYSSVSRDLPEMRMRVEFDYVLHPRGTKGVVTREFYCLRE